MTTASLSSVSLPSTPSSYSDDSSGCSNDSPSPVSLNLHSDSDSPDRRLQQHDEAAAERSHRHSFSASPQPAHSLTPSPPSPPSPLAGGLPCLPSSSPPPIPPRLNSAPEALRSHSEDEMPRTKASVQPSSHHYSAAVAAGKRSMVRSSSVAAAAPAPAIPIRPSVLLSKEGADGGKVAQLQLQSRTPPQPLRSPHRRVRSTSSSLLYSVSPSGSAAVSQSPQSSPLSSPAGLPLKFHLLADDGLPITSPSSSSSSPQSTLPSTTHWTVYSPTNSGGESPSAADKTSERKPPSPPPLNHTNTFHRTTAPFHGALHHDAVSTPPRKLSPLQSSRAVSVPDVLLVSEEDKGRKQQAAAGRKPPSPPVTPLPPPPSPSHWNISAPGETTASNSKQPTSTPVSAAAPPSPPLPPALSMLHASYVYVRTASALLNRWQRRWLMLSQQTQHPSTYRLTLYSRPGEQQATDSLSITPGTALLPENAERRPCRLKLSVAASGEQEQRLLSFESMTPEDRQQWQLSLQQAILMAKHQAAMLASSPRSLTFPPPISASTSDSSNGSVSMPRSASLSVSISSSSSASLSPAASLSLTPFQAFFLHLYYCLPEVGYVHSHYDHTLSRFRAAFPHELSIVSFMLREIRELGEKEGKEEEPRTVGLAVTAANAAAMTAYLSSKFESTSLPAQLVQHTLATAAASSASSAAAHPETLLHVPSAAATHRTAAKVMVDPLSQSQLIVAPNAQTGTGSTSASASAFTATSSSTLDKQRFEQAMHSPATLHHLRALLQSADHALSAAAFRLLWLLLSNVYPAGLTSAIFSAYLTQTPASSLSSAEMVESMRIVLFSPSLAQELGLVGLRTAFLRPLVLPALLNCLTHAAFPLRESTLKDLSACLLQNAANVGALSTLSHWQTMLFSLLTDVEYALVRDIGGLEREGSSDSECEQLLPASSAMQGRGITWHEDVTSRADYAAQRACYSYVHNILATMHYRAFCSSSAFTSTLCGSIDQLFAFAGPRVSTQKTAMLLFFSLLSLIEKNVARRSVLRPSQASGGQDWLNLRQLLSVIRCYVFYCHHWIPTDTDTHTYIHSSSPSVRMVLYQCKFRHPAFVPFAQLMAAAASPSPVFDTLGVHFDERDAAADLPLLRRVLVLLVSMRLDVSPLAAGSPHMEDTTAADREELLSLHHECRFFVDSLEFLLGLQSRLQERLQYSGTMGIAMLREAVVAFVEEEAAKQRKEREARGKQAKTGRQHRIASTGKRDGSPSASLDSATQSSPSSVPQRPPSTPLRQTLHSSASDLSPQLGNTPTVRRQLHNELQSAASTHLAAPVTRRAPSPLF